MTRLPPPTAAEVEIMVSAVRRWWRQYGRGCSQTRTLTMFRGWRAEDVEAEVILSCITKAQGKSRWDGERSNVDAWAGIVGRSRLLHLLDRKPKEAPSIIDPLRGLGSSSDEAPAPEPAAIEWPSFGEQEPQTSSEIRVLMGLDMDRREYEREINPWIDFFDELYGGDE